MRRVAIAALSTAVVANLYLAVTTESDLVRVLSIVVVVINTIAIALFLTVVGRRR